MLIVVGNKKQNINEKELENIFQSFRNTFLDIGTGDGRFIYENALKCPEDFFVGMDPAEKQLEIYSKKANRKKLKNCLFVIGSIDNTPPELFSKIDKIFITLPWGTLLANVVKTKEVFVSTIDRLLKKDGSVEIIFGYLSDLEPSETKRLDLPDTENGFEINQILTPLREFFEIEEMKIMSKNEVGKLQTTWAKKLKFGKDRKIYKINLRKKPKT